MKKKLLSFALAGLMTLSATAAMPIQAFANSNQDAIASGVVCEGPYISVDTNLFYGDKPTFVGVLDITQHIFLIDLFWNYLDDGARGQNYIMLYLVNPETKEEYSFALGGTHSGGAFVDWVRLPTKATLGEYHVYLRHFGMNPDGTESDKPVWVRGEIYSYFSCNL